MHLSIHLECDQIFIDYGDEWEEAWKKHIKDWHPENNADEYQDASTLNCFDEDDCKNTPVIRTDTQQMVWPYAENLDIYCFFNATDSRDDLDEVFWEAEL